MFSNFTVGIVLGIGVGGWVYGKAMHANGGLVQRALITAVVAGIVACILATTLLGIFFHSS